MPIHVHPLFEHLREEIEQRDAKLKAKIIKPAEPASKPETSETAEVK